MSSLGSIGFTAGGIDVSQIVGGLMEVERQPLLRLQSRQAAVKLQSDVIGRLKSSLDGLKSQAAALIATGGFMKLSSSVSGSGNVSASVRSDALPGSITFTVDRLARAHGLRTSGTVASSNSVVTSAANLAVSSTTGRIGASSVTAAPAVPAGKYTVSVTQASAAARTTGTAPLAGNTTITAGVNDTITLNVNGVARNVTLAPGGPLDAAGLVAAVQGGLDAATAGATASLDNTGRLVISTVREGSAATVELTGGNALAGLGLTAGPATTGVDGLVKIGANPVTTVSSIEPGGTVAVDTGNGNLTLGMSGGLRAGDATVAVVSTGDRSLGAVVSAINGANVGVSAAAVKVADGAWLMQLNAASTGTTNAIAVDPGAFDLAGSLLETSVAQDAQITIGSGPGSYSVTASGNSFADVLPGVTLTASTASATPVTVTVARDDNAIADQVGKLVEKISAVIAEINLQTKYDPATKKAAPLSGDANVRAMAAELRAAVANIVPGGTTSLASNVGITTQRDGTLKFDRGLFLSALQADPVGVERLFARGGTPSVGGAAFASATDKTVAGAYVVDVTAPGTRATVTTPIAQFVPGNVIAVRIGAKTATYEAGPGATAADIAAGLNTSLAAAGLKINAEVVGGDIKLTSVDYGGAGSFELNTDLVDTPAAWSTHAGTDVAGTIDGQTAVGVGRELRLLDTATSGARGLTVTVPEGALGNLGEVTYEPGIAARLGTLATRATDVGGALATSTSTYDSRIKTFTDQISRFEDRLALKETQMRRQWTAVQSLLSSLQTQGDWLAGQIGGLPKVASSG